MLNKTTFFRRVKVYLDVNDIMKMAQIGSI